MSRVTTEQVLAAVSEVSDLSQQVQQKDLAQCASLVSRVDGMQLMLIRKMALLKEAAECDVEIFAEANTLREELSSILTPSNAD